MLGRCLYEDNPEIQTVLWDPPQWCQARPWRETWRKEYTPVERCITDPVVSPRLRLFGHALRSAFLCRPEHLRGLSNTSTGAHFSSIPDFTNLPDDLNFSAGAGSTDEGTHAPVSSTSFSRTSHPQFPPHHPPQHIHALPIVVNRHSLVATRRTASHPAPSPGHSLSISCFCHPLRLQGEDERRL